MSALVVDSQRTLEAALGGLDPTCPAAVRARQALVDVEHLGFDGRLHRGQVVIDARLADDLRAVFALALELGFPIGSAIPLSDPRFAWDDVRSMEANNASGFNWRVVAGTDRLSHHAFGRAFDLNPRQNPWMAPHGVQPAGAVHDPAAPGTLTHEHPLVQAFLERGWEWGGTWTGTVDLHHFQKPGRGESVPGTFSPGRGESVSGTFSPGGGA